MTFPNTSKFVKNTGKISAQPHLLCNTVLCLLKTMNRTIAFGTKALCLSHFFVLVNLPSPSKSISKSKIVLDLEKINDFYLILRRK